MMVSLMKGAAILSTLVLFHGAAAQQTGGGGLADLIGNLDLSFNSLGDCVNVTAFAPFIHAISSPAYTKIVNSVLSIVNKDATPEETRLELTSSELEEVCRSLNPPEGEMAKVLKATDLRGAIFGYAAQAPNCNLKAVVPLIPTFLGMTEDELVVAVISAISDFNIAYCTKKEGTFCGLTLQAALNDNTTADGLKIQQELDSLVNATSPVQCTAVATLTAKTGCCYNGYATFGSNVGKVLDKILLTVGKLLTVPPELSDMIKGYSKMPQNCVDGTQCSQKPGSILDFVKQPAANPTTAPAPTTSKPSSAHTDKELSVYGTLAAAVAATIVGMRV